MTATSDPNTFFFSFIPSLQKIETQIKHFFLLSAPRLVRLTTKLNNVVATEGKDAIFKCAVTPVDASVKWFHKNVPITVGPKYKTEHGAGTHSLTIASVTQKDAGEISVDAEGKTCKATLQVQRKRSHLCIQNYKVCDIFSVHFYFLQMNL